MAIFSVSDIVIAVTLVVNALVLISSKLPGTVATNQQYQRVALDESEENAGGYANNSVEADDYCGASSIAEQLMNPTTTASAPSSPSSAGGPIVNRLRSLIKGMRKYSCVIVIWNFFFVILMVFVFSN